MAEKSLPTTRAKVIDLSDDALHAWRESRTPDITGRSKRLWLLPGGLCTVELIPSLRSYTFNQNEMFEDTGPLRLDFHERAAPTLEEASMRTAFIPGPFEENSVLPQPVVTFDFRAGPEEPAHRRGLSPAARTSSRGLPRQGNCCQRLARLVARSCRSMGLLPDLRSGPIERAGPHLRGLTGLHAAAAPRRFPLEKDLLTWGIRE